MPNREAHLGIGLVIFLIYYFILDYFSLTHYLYFGATVFVGAILPDLLDPWTKENRYEHRNVWHSTNLFMPLLVIGGFSLILMFLYSTSLYLLFFVIGYLPHLLADSVKTHTLSKGLPSYPTFFEGIKRRYNF